MMKVLTVVGARPQFIKAAPLSLALQATPGLEHVLLHTGQHYDPQMSRAFFEELDLPEPQHHLHVGSGHHGAQTGQMLQEVERALMQERPDAVVVFGDTNSTLAGALAASKLHIPVAHVEAGLRSGDRSMPEEINRVLTDHISDLMFVPTQDARRNLLREGRPQAQIHLVGDIMLDVARLYAPRAQAQSRVLEALGLEEGGFGLVTIHRASNTDAPARLAAIAEALCRFGARRRLVWPLHPRTRGALEAHGWLERVQAALAVVEPVGYLDMLRLTQGARLVITDSGGLQKEAFFHQTPCLTLRDHTEWRELLDLGWNRLVPPREPQALLEALEGAWGAPVPQEAPPVYGDGDSAREMVRILCESLERQG